MGESKVKKILILTIFAGVCLCMVKKAISHQEENSVSITILFDNYAHDSHLKFGWGFSCLVEYQGYTLLFDTGNDGDALLFNMNNLNINTGNIDAVIISHAHSDHTGGLLSFTKMNPDIPLFIPSSYESTLRANLKNKKVEIVPVERSMAIFKYIYVTEELGEETKEISLILDSELGLIVITGCAHPGILNILNKSKELMDKPIYFVLGGFHLNDKSSGEINEIVEQFRKLGISYVGATHCTGDLAIKTFKQEFKDKFVTLGSGRKLFIEQQSGIKTDILDEKIRKESRIDAEKEMREQKNVKDEVEERIIEIGNKKIVITGSLTFGQIERITGVPAHFLTRKLGIPPNYRRNLNLGRLRRMYNFKIQDVRKYIREYLKKQGS